jgi:hypothetical protein
LDYEFRIQQFDLIKTVEANVTKKLFKGVKTMPQRLLREVFCLEHRVDFDGAG